MGSIASPSSSTSRNSAVNQQVGQGGGTGNITLGAITTAGGRVTTTGGSSSSTRNTSSASGNASRATPARPLTTTVNRGQMTTAPSRGGVGGTGGGTTIIPTSGGGGSGNVNLNISTPDAAAVQAVEDVSVAALNAQAGTLATALNANADLSGIYANVASQALQSGQNTAALAIPTYGAQSSIQPLDTVGATGAPPSNTPSVLLLISIALGAWLILKD